jgi:hypothetical protein
LHKPLVGFYSHRLKKRELTGIEAADVAGLVEEIALIRVFTRRLVESFDPNGDFYEHADLLLILCVASAAITRVIRAQYLISSAGTGMDDDITEAIRQVNTELHARLTPSTSVDLGNDSSDESSTSAAQPDPTSDA